MADEFEKWSETQEFQVPLDSKGKIIDILDKTILRDNTPEERVRQRIVNILLHELNYPASHIALERTIKSGRQNIRSDIVIYNSAEACSINDQGQICISGETKAPNIKAPDGQEKSYIASSSAQGGFWTNGSIIYFYRKHLPSGAIKNWIGLPKFGSSWDSVGKYSKSDLIVPVDLKLAFKRCHNAIYRAGIDSEDVALDMVRILLAKIEDESSSNESCQFYITQEEYDNEILRLKACLRTRKLFEFVKDRYPDVFSDSEEITASDSQLAIVIAHLQQYSLLDAPYDVIGTAYEVYVASHLKGERGQFFTNRHVVNMMVSMLNPTEKDIILDPSCGSGGFLLNSMNYIFNHIEQSNRSGNAKEILKRNVVHQLFGIDISPKLVKIAKANMLLGKDGHGGIERANSLDSIEKLSAKFRERADIGMVSMIMTNPPFGSGHDIRVKEPNILRNYAAGHTWRQDDSGAIIYEDKLNSSVGVAPELLFLERCIEWLKPAGYLAIVMAKGQLDNREAYAIRHRVLSTCNLLAVVNLHEDTFEPFCGSKASVLFLQKKSDPSEKQKQRVFMAISNKIGQTSRGEAIFKRDNEGKPLIENGCYVFDEDLSDISKDYKSFKGGTLQESSFKFSVDINTIAKSSLSFNPIQYLPAYNEAYQKVLKLADSDKFEVHRLGDIATVYNGPRFKRPYADLGVTTGQNIRKYFTGTALTQSNAENVKYLDEAKCTKQQLKQLEQLTIYKGYILISDSGTLGRVTYALSAHDGHVATNNLIRVVIEDKHLRGYVYQFLKSDIGQALMLKNAYGTNQEHLEPDVISEIPIPVLRDKELEKHIGRNVLGAIEHFEKSLALTFQSELDIINAIEVE